MAAKARSSPTSPAIPKASAPTLANTPGNDKLTDSLSKLIVDAQVVLDAMGDDDYSSEIRPPAQETLNSLEAIRRLLWSSADAAHDRYAAAEALIASRADAAARATPAIYGGPESNQAAAYGASRAVIEDAQRTLGEQVIQEQSDAIANAGTRFGTAYESLGTALTSAYGDWQSPDAVSRVRSKEVDLDAHVKETALVREMKGNERIVTPMMATFDALKQGDPRVLRMWLRAARVVLDDVIVTPPPKMAARLSDDAQELLKTERALALQLRDQIAAWRVSSRPASLGTGAELLMRARGVSHTMIGSEPRPFAVEYSIHGQATPPEALRRPPFVFDTTATLRRWLPPWGVLPAWSEIEMRTPTGVPIRKA